jgi:hypothetical protein
MSKPSYRRNRRNRKSRGFVGSISKGVGDVGNKVVGSVGKVGKSVVGAVNKTPGFLNRGFTKFKKLFGFNTSSRKKTRRHRH